jgi:hypothetical protein
LVSVFDFPLSDKDSRRRRIVFGNELVIAEFVRERLDVEVVRVKRTGFEYVVLHSIPFASSEFRRALWAAFFIPSKIR